MANRLDTTSLPIIFLAFANDRDDRARYLRNLAEEARRLREALAPAERAGLCRVVVRQNATVQEIFDVFQDAQNRNRVAVFHYGGHADSYRLLFEGAAGEPAPADAAGLAAFLGHQIGLQLAFLNGCSTQSQAQGLLDAGVAVVVATSQAIDDRAATEFASRFYAGLAGGATLGTAFGEAQAALRTEGGVLTRHIGAVENGGQPADDRLPWERHVQSGAEAALDWSLPVAAQDPLYGLPPLPPLDLPDRPYRYLDWYRREDAEIFSGRGREIRELYDCVTAPGRAPIVLFYGQSGVGKSSLLAAGLLPRLEASHQVQYCRRDRALGLSGTLAAALISVTSPTPESAERQEEVLAAVWRRREAEAGKPLLIILDQAEEAFTRPNPEQPAELAAFLDALAGLFTDPAQRPQGKLVLGFRKEWLAEISQRLIERQLPRSEVFLERLDRQGVIEVVTGPQRTARLRAQYGLTIADPLLPGLITDDLLADRESPVAPMLAILLSDMWDAAKAHSHNQPVFDTDLYRDYRARGLSLNDFLGRQLQALRGTHPEVVGSGLALDLLAYHTTPLGTAEQRTLADLQETYRHQAATLPGLAQACQDLYLLVDPSRNQPDQPSASRLTHDTLAPHVRVRFDESDAAGQRARRILESRAVDWEDGAQGTPLDDADLKVVEAGQAGMRALSATEARLVEASQAQRAQRQCRSRLVRGILIGLAALIAVTAGLAIWQASIAIQARNVAKARQLAANAVAELSSDPELSLLLATESAFINHTAQTEEAVRQSLQQAHLYATLSATDPMNLFGVSKARPKTARFSPDSRYVLGVFDCIDAIWSIETRELVAELDLSESMQTKSGSGASCSGSNFAVFSPTGSLILTSYGQATEQRATTVWETASGRKVAVFEPASHIWGAAFNHSEEFVVTAEGAFIESPRWGMAQVWSISTGKVVRQLYEPTNAAIENASFSPNDNWILTTTSGTARVWDWKTGDSLSAFNYPYDSFPPVFSPGGQWILTTVDNVIARTLDPTSGETVAEFDHGGAMSGAQFSPDGLYVITGGGPAARVWQTATGAAVSTMHGFSDELRVIGFSPDSKYVLTIEGKVAQVWEAQTGKLVSLLAGHNEEVDSAAFSHDGRLVVTTGRDGIARVWAADSGALLAELRGHTSSVFDAAFSDDDNWLLTVSYDNTVRIWDANTVSPTPELRGSGALDIAISPDSEYIVTVNNQDARVWELPTGRVVSELRGAVHTVSAAFISPDGRLVVLQGDSRRDRTSQVVEAKTGREVAALGGIVYLVEDAALSADGRLASIIGGAWPNGSGKVVYSWELSTGARLVSTPPWAEDSRFDLDGHFVINPAGLWSLESGKHLVNLQDEEPVFSQEIVVSPDRSTLLAIKPAPILWNARTGQKVVDLAGHSGTVHTARYSHNAALLVTAASDDKVALVWNTSTGRQLAALPHDSDVNDAAFSPDDSLIITASDDNVARVWDAQGGIVADLPAAKGPLHSAEFSPDGAYVATESTGGSVQVWASATWTLLSSVTGTAPVFSPDGKLLTTSASDALVWDTRTGDLLFTWELVQPWWGYGIERLAHRPRFSRDGKFVAIEDRAYGQRYRTAVGFRVWNLDTGRELIPQDAVIVAVEMDSTRALLLNPGGDFQLWNFGTDEPGMILGGEALQPTFSPNNQMVATVGGKAAQLWNATTGQPLHTLIGHTDSVNSVRFAPDGGSLVTASSDQTARTWDSQTGRALRELKGHTARVTDAMFTPDGQTIITVSNDGTLRMWNASTGEQTQAIEYAGPPATPVVSVKWSDELGVVPPGPRVLSTLSPDGKYLVTLDGSELAVWDPNTAKKIAAIDYRSGSIPSFSPDGRWLAVSDVQGARVIETATGRLLAQLSDSGGDVEFAQNGRYIAVGASIFPPERFLPYADLLALASNRSSRRLTCDEKRAYVNEQDACTAELAAEARLAEGRELAAKGDVTGAAAKFREALASDKTIRIEPETEARRLAIDALISWGTRLARQGMIADAVVKYSQASQLDPALKMDPLETARGHALRAAIEGLAEDARHDDSEGVVTGLQSALAVADPPPKLPASMWNTLCWYATLCGHADQVVQGACEEAVSLADVASYRDSRGLARALTGDVQGALADFRVFLAKGGHEYEREQWVERLEKGEDPKVIFDAETLRRLLR